MTAEAGGLRWGVATDPGRVRKDIRVNLPQLPAKESPPPAKEVPTG